MIAPLIAFSLMGLVIFYVQNLVFFPYVHLRLLALLLFYVGLRPSLGLPLALGLACLFLRVIVRPESHQRRPAANGRTLVR